MCRESVVVVIFPGGMVIMSSVFIGPTRMAYRNCQAQKQTTDNQEYCFFHTIPPSTTLHHPTSKRNPRKEVSPLSKKRKPQYPSGWSPPNAVAWCAYHNTGMNYSFIRRRRCLLHKKPCKHLHWFADAINHDEEQMI